MTGSLFDPLELYYRCRYDIRSKIEQFKDLKFKQGTLFDKRALIEYMGYTEKEISDNSKFVTTDDCSSEEVITRFILADRTKGIPAERLLKDERALRLLTYADFEKLKVPKNYYVEKMLPPESLCMIYSPPAQFKSLILSQMCFAIATGRPFMGLKTKKGPVLICDKENSEAIHKERLKQIKNGLKVRIKPKNLYFLPRSEGNLDDKLFLKRLHLTIKALGIKIVCFDTLNRFSDYDENSATDVSKLYSNVFIPLIDKFGVTIIFLHHTNKSGTYRGSGDFSGMCDFVYKVERKRGSNIFTLFNEKNRYGEIESISGKIEFSEKAIEFKELAKSESAYSESQVKKNKEAIIELLADGKSRKRSQLINELELNGIQYGSESTIKRSLNELKKEEKVTCDEKYQYRLIGLGQTTLGEVEEIEIN